MLQVHAFHLIQVASFWILKTYQTQIRTHFYLLRWKENILLSFTREEQLDQWEWDGSFHGGMLINYVIIHSCKPLNISRETHLQNITRFQMQLSKKRDLIVFTADNSGDGSFTSDTGGMITATEEGIVSCSNFETIIILGTYLDFLGCVHNVLLCRIPV